MNYHTLYKLRRQIWLQRLDLAQRDFDLRQDSVRAGVPGHSATPPASFCLDLEIIDLIFTNGFQ